jgi:signal transduction histidine kinase
VSPLSIRARLAFAFAAALVLVLVLAGAFVYLRVQSTLTSDLDDRLETQAAELAALVEADAQGERSPLPGPADPEDGFSQVLAPDGRVLASTLPPDDGAVLRPGSLPEEPLELPVAGVDGDARVVAAEVDGPGGPRIVVAGASTDDRAEALAGIAGAFAVGGPIAVLLAAGLGYLLAARSLAPVESIRRRAGEITLEHGGERLPLPAADDEIRRLAETLNTMLDRIEASLERERVFVADASHELRTPLAVLRAELELAERPGREPEEMRAALRSAAEETDRLSRLAEGLLVLARSDEGGLPLKRERTELEPVLGAVRDRYLAAAAERGRMLRVECEPGLAADIDRMRIEQALGNLVDNALAHGDGAVTLAAGRAGEGLRLEVRDEGAGFPSGFADEAFGRFTRADPGRTGGGAGLGLAIVRAIAEAHGGSARIASSGSHPASVEILL